MNPFLLAAIIIGAVVFLPLLAAVVAMNIRDMANTTTYGCQACEIPLTQFTAAEYDQHQADVHGMKRTAAADPWAGATEEWSPSADVAEIDEELTPTELLPSRIIRPAVVVPETAALEADAHDTLGAKLDAALAPGRQRLDLMVKACEIATTAKPFQTVYRALWEEIPTGLYPLVSVAA